MSAVSTVSGYLRSLAEMRLEAGAYLGRRTVEDVTEVTRSAITNAVWRFDLTRHLLAGMRERLDVWIDEPLWVDRQDRFTVRLWAWPPKMRTHCHEHTSWGVTGVVAGELRITLYDWDDALGGCLRATRSIDAAEGQVGSVTCPCIHQIENPADETGLSLNLYSHFDDQALARSVQPAIAAGGAQTRALNANVPPGHARGELFLSALVRLASTLTTESRREVLERIFLMSRGPARLAAAKQLMVSNPGLKRKLLGELLGSIPTSSSVSRQG